MAAVARSGGLWRPKWDERHSSDGRTYLELTIGTAIAGCAQTYRELVGHPADAEWPRLRPADRTPPEAEAWS